jgi:acetyltransferase-like isoleucine patch superfamily enzyme
MTAREVAKAIARALATIVISPALLSFWIRATLMGPDRALEGSTQALSLVPGLAGQYLRRAFLAHAIAGCHRSATIEFGTIFSKVDAIIDENVYVGARCHIGLAHIEANVLIGSGVHVPSGARTHGMADRSTPIRDQTGTRAMIRVGRGSWIGSGAIVMADVGSECVVGAGAVVTRALPDAVVAAGVPARVVRNRHDQTTAVAPSHRANETTSNYQAVSR